ncbi:hypothetical protein CR155_03705 [Pollutimonas nitritireducens]|uniref:DUF1468 domain-containing protein n=1 Tax=Pollutimonas nitritireducens TaxID=2045209 RepID=A0A2N4UJX8_9BURK|nr:hypothetical protein CR155_03705 [Pollutimonas nitritireducens]
MDRAPPTLLLNGRAMLVAVAIISLCCFVWMAWLSMAFPDPFNNAEVGPARVPLIASAGGILTGLGLIVHAFRQKSNYMPPVAIRKPLGVFAALLFTILWVEAMPRMGFYFASGVVVPLIMFAGGERRPLMLVSAAVGFVVFVHLCFSFLLDIEFP